MLYVATAKPSYLLGGLGAGAFAAVIAYHLFSHVQVRVAVWQDPFSMIEGECWYASLCLPSAPAAVRDAAHSGRPFDIPVRESDFIFSVISEEFGVIFGMPIFVLISCFILFMDISTQAVHCSTSCFVLALVFVFIFRYF